MSPVMARIITSEQVLPEKGSDDLQTISKVSINDVLAASGVVKSTKIDTTREQRQPTNQFAEVEDESSRRGRRSSYAEMRQFMDTLETEVVVNIQPSGDSLTTSLSLEPEILSEFALSTRIPGRVKGSLEGVSKIKESDILEKIEFIAESAKKLNPVVTFVKGILKGRQERDVKREEVKVVIRGATEFLGKPIEDLEKKWFDGILPFLRERRAEAWKKDLKKFSLTLPDLLRGAGVDDKQVAEWMKHIPTDLKFIGPSIDADGLVAQLKEARNKLIYLNKHPEVYNIKPNTRGALAQIGIGTVLIVAGNCILPAISIPIIGAIIGSLPVIYVKVGTSMVIEGAGRLM